MKSVINWGHSLSGATNNVFQRPTVKRNWKLKALKSPLGPVIVHYIFVSDVVYFGMLSYPEYSSSLKVCLNNLNILLLVWSQGGWWCCMRQRSRNGSVSAPKAAKRSNKHLPSLQVLISYTVLEEVITIPLERIEATMPNPANTFIYNIFLQPALDSDITLCSLLQSFSMWKEHQPCLKHSAVHVEIHFRAKSPFSKQDSYCTTQNYAHTPSQWVLLCGFSTSAQAQPLAGAKSMWMIPSMANMQEQILPPAFKKFYFLQSTLFISINITVVAVTVVSVNIKTFLLGWLSS